MNCPECETELENGFIYVRGVGSSLAWSTEGSTRFFSKKELDQINLTELSTTPTGGQAVLPSWRCNGCTLVMFKSARQ